MFKSISSLYKEKFSLSRRDPSLMTRLEIPAIMSFRLRPESRVFILFSVSWMTDQVRHDGSSLLDFSLLFLVSGFRTSQFI